MTRPSDDYLIALAEEERKYPSVELPITNIRCGLCGRRLPADRVMCPADHATDGAL